MAAGHDPIVADMTNCVVEQEQQPLEIGRHTRRRFLDHQEQANRYSMVQSALPLVALQEAALAKHYTLFPEAAGLLSNNQDQYSCLTHEMVDLTGQTFDSPDDVLYRSTGSTRLSLHPVQVREQNGARIQAKEGKVVQDDLTLTLCTSARRSESERVNLSIV